MSTDSDVSSPREDDLSSELIDRYWCGETSLVESARVEVWFQAHPDAYARHAQLAAMLTTDRVLPRVPEDWARREAVALAASLRAGELAGTSAIVGGMLTGAERRGAVLAFPRQTAQRSAEVAGPATVRKLFGAWPQRRLVPHSFGRAVGFGGVLGVVILALGIGTLLARPRWFRAGSMTTSSTASITTEVATQRGQRASVRLADGTRVTLGVASRVRYPREFGATSRDVELEGEAYFDVVHDGRAPFRVRTAHGVTEDVGTKFAVRAYAGESQTRVVVEEGKVAVAPGMTLGAGDVARMRIGAAPTVAHGVPVDRLLSWTTGQLEFVHVPLREVAAELERWYDITLHVPEGPLADAPVTAAFRDAPVQGVIAFIASVVNARVERTGAEYRLVPDPAAWSLPSTHSPMGSPR